MPLFAAQSDADLAAVLTYLRSSWGQRSSAVTVADIQAARAVHTAR
jgi:mono/diheme cytochrome c family protein